MSRQEALPIEDSPNRGLSWSGRWHLIRERPSSPYVNEGLSLCGAYVYTLESAPKRNERLQDIIAGRKQGPVCKKCEQVGGYRHEHLRATNGCHRQATAMSTETTYQPPQLTTDDELNENWHMGTVVQEIHTGTCCPDDQNCDFYPQVWEMVFQCGWARAGRYYDDDDCTPRIPARLLWNPEWVLS